MNNMYIISAENATVVLNNLKSLDRPLTAEEKKLGRKAALAQADALHSQALASAASLRETELKFYMGQGHTLDEAREQLRLDKRIHDEKIGLGKSHRCHPCKAASRYLSVLPGFLG